MLDLLSLQKKFILEHLGEGDCAVDFTMGNGHDTVFLSKTVGRDGRVYAFDIQEEALVSTERNLKRSGCPENWKLIKASHDLADRYVKEKIKAGMFNLGYLPGAGKRLLPQREPQRSPQLKKPLACWERTPFFWWRSIPDIPREQRRGRSLKRISALFPDLNTGSRK